MAVAALRPPTTSAARPATRPNFDGKDENGDDEDGDNGDNGKNDGDEDSNV